MSKKSKLSKEDKLLLKRCVECTRLLMQCAKINNFTSEETSLSIKNIFISYIIFIRIEKERIEKIMDEMKKTIFKELNY